MQTSIDIVIPSGSSALNTALGIGGYPRGRIVEIAGPESSDKITLALHAIAQCQSAGGVAAFIDVEHRFEPSHAVAVGVVHDKLLLSQPESGEQALDMAATLARPGKGNAQLVVIDSVVAITRRAADWERGLGTGRDDGGRLMSHALRKLTAIAHKSTTTVVFLNQVGSFAPAIGFESSPGGNALKFYASVRLDVRRVGDVEEGGVRTRVKVIKNKCAAPFGTAEFVIRDGRINELPSHGGDDDVVVTP